MDFPKLVTLSGIIILFNAGHSENARSPMLVTPSGIVIFSRYKHLVNVLSSTQVIVSGSVRFLMLVAENAFFRYS